jgi:TonB family protein
VSSTQARKAYRDQLPTAILLAVLLHAVAFVALELFLKFAPQREPQYTGPMFVQLEELPVVQEAREPAVRPRPAPSPGSPQAQSAVPAAAVAVTPAQPAEPQLPSGPPLRAAGEPVPATAPKGSPFRMEGSPSKEGQPQPAGESFQISSQEPTLPPSGVPAQGPPLRAEAPGSGQKTPSVPMEAVDRALAAAGKGGAAAGGAAAAGSSGSGAGTAAGTSASAAGTSAGQNYAIVWENSALGREPLSMPRPVIPAWVSNAGLRLELEIDFALTPQGVLRSVRVSKSSGYSDVDSSVLDAVRRWKFKPGGKRDETVNGRVSYLILPR